MVEGNYPLNMIAVAVEAWSPEDAGRKAGLIMVRDCTAVWSLRGKPMDVLRLSEFSRSVLENTTKLEPGKGCYVTLRKPTKAKYREKPCRTADPWELSDLETCYVVYDDKGDEALHMWGCTGKDDAVKRIRRLMESGKLFGSEFYELSMEYRFPQGARNTVCRFEIPVTKGAAKGKYLVFGVMPVIWKDL